MNQFAIDQFAMDQFVERQNIAQYVGQLKTEKDPIKRPRLERLLAKERAKQASYDNMGKQRLPLPPIKQAGVSSTRAAGSGDSLAWYRQSLILVPAPALLFVPCSIALEAPVCAKRANQD